MSAVFIADTVRALIDGNLNAVVPAFSCPAAVYVAGRIAVCTTPGEIRDLAEQFHTALVGAGIRGVDISVAAESLPRGPRRSIWLQNTYLDAEGHPVDHAMSRHFYSIEFGRPAIHIVDYIRAPVEDRIVELPFYKKAA